MKQYCHQWAKIPPQWCDRLISINHVISDKCGSTSSGSLYILRRFVMLIGYSYGVVCNHRVPVHMAYLCLVK